MNNTSAGSNSTSNSAGAVSPPAATSPVLSATAISLKLSPFWLANPLVWFAQVDAQFTTRNITSEKTKFDYVVASLAPEFAQEVCDLILKPPASSPYSDLRKILEERTGASEQRCLQQLFNAEELGDHKPTQLLRRMQQLLEDKASSTDASFLRELFLQRHPPIVLASSETTDLVQIAQLADKVVEVATPQVSSATLPNHPANPDLNHLRAEIAELKQMLSSLQLPSNRWPRPQSRGTTPRSSRSSTPTRSTSDSLYWYHTRFGDLAHKCQPPCSKSTPENAQASH